MKRALAYAGLLLLSLLAACPKRQTTQPDYNQIRQDSEQSHKQLDQQQMPTGQ
jgi:hypothetical protein